MIEKIRKVIGDRRTEKDMTYQELADAVGEKKTDAWNLINGKRNPTFSTLEKYLVELDLDMQITAKKPKGKKA
ncbi:helix-turn-helix domain-containing protein [Fulvitalea axinellae]